MRKTLQLLSLLLSLALFLTACATDGDGDDPGTDSGDTTEDTTDGDTSDDEDGDASDDESAEDDGLPLAEMNDQPRESLVQGGDLSFAISLFPSNWNSLNVDGNTVPQNRIEDFTMPRNWICLLYTSPSPRD